MGLVFSEVARHGLVVFCGIDFRSGLMNVSELAKLDLYLKDNGVEYTSNPTDKIVKLFLLFDMVPIYCLLYTSPSPRD